MKDNLGKYINNPKTQEQLKVLEKINELEEEIKKTTDEKRKEEINQLIEKCRSTLIAINISRGRTKTDKPKGHMINSNTFKKR